jgi:hypothetical protein
MSWLNTAQEHYYVEALGATNGISQPAVGFHKPSPVAEGVNLQTQTLANVATVSRQLNTLIELHIQQLKALESLAERVERIEASQANFAITPSQLQGGIKEIQEQLAKVQITGPVHPPKPVNKVYYYTNPLDLVKQAQEEAKR